MSEMRPGPAAPPAACWAPGCCCAGICGSCCCCCCCFCCCCCDSRACRRQSAHGGRHGKSTRRQRQSGEQGSAEVPEVLRTQLQVCIARLASQSFSTRAPGAPAPCHRLQAPQPAVAAAAPTQPARQPTPASRQGRPEAAEGLAAPAAAAGAGSRAYQRPTLLAGLLAGGAMAGQARSSGQMQINRFPAQHACSREGHARAPLQHALTCQLRHEVLQVAQGGPLLLLLLLQRAGAAACR